jgi:multidrug efflux pump subunit AcrA (membrane-fusion protein)
VIVNVRETSRNVGVMVPKSALVRRTNGEMVVWVVIGPEQYKPQRVKWRSVSLGVAEIESGLSDRTRVVVAGANLLSEIR